MTFVIIISVSTKKHLTWPVPRL